jgi:hypothetical protein
MPIARRRALSGRVRLTFDARDAHVFILAVRSADTRAVIDPGAGGKTFCIPLQPAWRIWSACPRWRDPELWLGVVVTSSNGTRPLVDIVDSPVEGAVMRLRPITMTRLVAMLGLLSAAR